MINFKVSLLCQNSKGLQPVLMMYVSYYDHCNNMLLSCQIVPTTVKSLSGHETKTNQYSVTQRVSQKGSPLYSRSINILTKEKKMCWLVAWVNLLASRVTVEWLFGSFTKLFECNLVFAFINFPNSKILSFSLPDPTNKSQCWEPWHFW